MNTENSRKYYILAISVFRSVVLLFMEIMCLNNLIWYYDWSLVESCVQIAAVVGYFVLSVALFVLGDGKCDVFGKGIQMLAVLEGIISGLFVCFLVEAVNFTGIEAWLILLLQVCILASSVITYLRATAVKRKN